MQFPPEIAFRGFEPDEWLKDDVEREVEKLDAYFDRITGCRVMVELPHQRREEGNAYHVRIELSVPGRNLVVSRAPQARERERETQLNAIDEAFSAIRRRLEDYARELRGDVKRKHEQAHGRVWRLYPGAAEGERYGFIRTFDGDDVYFHENSLLGVDFDQVEVGMEVRFHEEQGDEGPQASTVRLLQRPAAAAASGRTPADNSGNSRSPGNPGADGGSASATPGGANGGAARSHPNGPDAGASNVDGAGAAAALSVENADRLLDELEEALAGLADGDRDPEVLERTEKLLSSLDDFPGPPALLRDPVEELRAWARILLDDDGNGSHPGPGSPVDIVETRIFRVREVLERERSLSA